MPLVVALHRPVFAGPVPGQEPPVAPAEPPVAPAEPAAVPALAVAPAAGALVPAFGAEVPAAGVPVPAAGALAPAVEPVEPPVAPVDGVDVLPPVGGVVAGVPAELLQPVARPIRQPIPIINVCALRICTSLQRKTCCSESLCRNCTVGRGLHSCPAEKAHTAWFSDISPYRAVIGPPPCSAVTLGLGSKPPNSIEKLVFSPPRLGRASWGPRSQGRCDKRAER
jgi:hypothetical protein